MNDVTRILSGVGHGDPSAASTLLPLVYAELRQLAAQRLSSERIDHTLPPTALVHEAYLRLVAPDQHQSWDGRGHFFAAAAEAMRRILVESARRNQAQKRGGGWQRQQLDHTAIVAPEVSDEVIAVNEALDRLTAADPRAAEVVKLRYFAGLTIKQVAETLSISPRTADSLWAYARAWLLAEIRRSQG